MGILSTIRKVAGSETISFDQMIQDEEGNFLSSVEIIEHSFEAQKEALKKAYDDRDMLVKAFDESDQSEESEKKFVKKVVKLNEGIEKASQRLVETQQELEVLSKGGEGSKGGKVIGHTKSGKPIYDKFNHPSHKNFTAEDHYNAADLHDELESQITKQSEQKRALHHLNQLELHEQAGDKLDLKKALSRSEEKEIELLSKASEEQQAKVKKVMDEWKSGSLNSSSGDKVTDHKQAIAIALSEAGLNKKKKKVKKAEGEITSEGDDIAAAMTTGNTPGKETPEGPNGKASTIAKLAKGEKLEVIKEDELEKAIDLSKLVRKVVQVQGKNGNMYTAVRWVDPNTGRSIVTGKESDDIAEFHGNDSNSIAMITSIIHDEDKAKAQKVRDLIGMGVYDKKMLMTLLDASVGQVAYEFKTLDIVGNQEEGGSSELVTIGGEVAPTIGPISTEGLTGKALQKMITAQRSKLREEKGLGYEKFWKEYDDTLKGVIVEGYPKSLIAYGTGGLGKTFSLMDTMRKLQIRLYDPEINPAHDQYDAVKISGSTGIRDMWAIIVENKDKLIIFDDCDSMWTSGDEDRQNILKGMLDTSGDGSVRYGNAGKDSNGTQLPKQIRFTGQVIFISNLKRDDFPQPLIDSRCASIDLTMTKNETMDKLNKIKDSIELRGKNDVLLEIPKASRQAAYSFFEKHKDQLQLGQINGRTFAQIAKIHADTIKQGGSEKDFEDKASIRMNLV